MCNKSFSLCIGTIVKKKKVVRLDLFGLGKVFSRKEEMVEGSLEFRCDLQQEYNLTVLTILYM
jgi:hypothetical protein